MLEKKFKITNELGLHARPATEMVQIANNYLCDITICLGNVTTNFKSIMGVLSLGATLNDVFKVTFDGVDEEEASQEFSLSIIEKNIGKEI